MKNKIINLTFVFLLLISLFGFFYINQTNYETIKEQKIHLVKHPELLPQKDILKYTSFGFANLRANLYWLETIQYIGGNALSAEYKKYLYSMLDIITELNPYFEKPYLIGQLLIPNYNQRYEELSDEEINKYNIQARLIGEKGIKNFCDEEKINLILNQNDLNEVWTKPQYKNPCNSLEIPFQQGFLEYYYLKDHKKSAQYYKIASADENSLSGAKIMAGIMNGKAGNREISIMTFLTLAQSKNIEGTNCSYFTDTLSQLSAYVFRLNNPIDSNIIKQLEALRKENLEFNPDNELEVLAGENCQNYINKSIREFNMAYLDQQNKLFYEKNNKNALTPEELLNTGFIDYTPKDFQQYQDYGIIYFFNEDSNTFDTKMSN